MKRNWTADGLLVPTANASEAAVVEGLNVYSIASLAQAVGFLFGQVDIDPESVDDGNSGDQEEPVRYTWRSGIGLPR